MCGYLTLRRTLAKRQRYLSAKRFRRVSMYINEKKKKNSKIQSTRQQQHQQIYMYTEKGKQKDKNRMQSY